MFQNIATSMRLTGASFRLIFRKPVVLTLPLLTLLWVSALVVGPLNFFIWLHENHPEQSISFWKGVFFAAVSSFEAGNYQGAFWAAIVTGYVIWAIWMTFALWGMLFFVTVGMDVATQQIKRQPVSLGNAFRLAARNLHRLLIMALVLATLVAWFKYAVTFVFRLVPFVGRFLNHAFRMALTAATYLMLPIVVYERAGAWSAFRSAWRSVRKTWSGILLGTSILYFGVWAIMNLVAGPLFSSTLGMEEAAMGSLVLGALIYAVASSTAAAMRATLYWYATTGEVPEGFNKTDLPTITSHSPFTGVAAASMVAVPSAPTATATFTPDAVQAPPKTARATPLPKGAKRTTCPQCKAAVVVPAGKKPYCSNCGFGTP